MDIQLLLPSLTTHSPVQIDIDDNGSAFVHATLSIPGVPILDYKETYSGSLTKVIPLPVGTYDCTFVDGAYRAGALGPVYNTTLKLNGTPVALASGSVPKDVPSDIGFIHFQLIIA